MVVNNKILDLYFKRRSFDDDFFEHYEDTTNAVMKYFDEMIDMLRVIHDQQYVMTIYTDFDVDGIMSGVVAYAGFSELGFKVRLFRPLTDAYGFRPDDVDAIHRMYPDTKVIFTGDVGVTANAAVKHAKDKGLIVLVTDHHTSDEASAADICVDPNQFGETYPHPDICGSHVIYLLLCEYAKRYTHINMQHNISRLRLFAGIATIADMMPLVYENRALVRDAISFCKYFYNYDVDAQGISIAPPPHNVMYDRAFAGMHHLLRFFKTCRKISSSGGIDESFLGFYLIPFLNSVKRMAGDISAAYDIFFGNDIDNIYAGIDYISTLNRDRKKYVDEYYAYLLEQANAYTDSGIYIVNVPAGLKGLIANKFLERTGMPCFVISRNADGTYSGSGRCPGWVDIRSMLNDAGLAWSAGHKAAFGVIFNDAESLDKYVDEIYPKVCKIYDELDTNPVVITISDVRDSRYDFTVNASDINDYLTVLDRYHPYGVGFEEPVFEYHIFNRESFSLETFGDQDQHKRIHTFCDIDTVMFYQDDSFDNVITEFDEDEDLHLVITGVFKYDNYRIHDADDEAEYMQFLGRSIRCER